MSFFDVARQHSTLMEDLPNTTVLTDEELLHVTGAWGGHGHQGHQGHHGQHERNEHHGHQGHHGHNRCDRDDRRHHECNN